VAPPTEFDSANTIVPSGSGSVFDNLISYQQLLQGDLEFYEYPIKAFQVGLELTQAVTGLPWWAVAIVSSVALRVALLPFQVKMTRFGSRMAAISPQIKKEAEAYQARAQARAAKGLPAEASQWGVMGQIYKKHGLSPMQNLKYAAPQIPIFLLLFLSLRNMCTDPAFFDTLVTGGSAWFLDLTRVHSARPPYAT